MKIADLYNKGKSIISFEVFPPKKDAGVDLLYSALDELAALNPSYISVTFGAGGKTKGTNLTADIAGHIKNNLKTETLAHLTSCGATDNDINSILQNFKEKGIENVLALRGDDASGKYKYAKDLISDIKGRGFCIGAAAYPEGHLASNNINDDIEHMLQKEEAGAEFFITQLFFDNNDFYGFLEKARKRGIKSPISAGVMPLLSRAQIERMIYMCGASLPSPIIKLIAKYENDPGGLTKAGVDYMVNQLRDLVDNKVDGVHLYTVNKPFIAKTCVNNLK